MSVYRIHLIQYLISIQFRTFRVYVDLSSVLLQTLIVIYGRTWGIWDLSSSR